MPRKYRKPPIVEAVCEFKFDPASSWDMAIPGLLYERLQKTYPEREQVRAVESLVEVVDEGLHQKVIQSDRVRFRKSDGQALVQVGEHLLVVNHLAPYPTWEGFRPMVLDALAAYRDVASPSGILRIGLRYINRIVLPMHTVGAMPTVELEDYFQLYPELGTVLKNQAFTTFLVGVQFPFDEERDLLRLQLASGSPDPDKQDTGVVVLDLDYFLANAGALGFDGLEAWLEQAHQRLEDVFEGCLKQTLRDLFGEVN